VTTGEPVAYASWDSVKLPIYYCPVRVRLKPGDDAAGGGNDSGAEGNTKFKIYPSYQIGFYEGGRWRTARATTTADAKVKGEKIAKRLSENGSKTIVLPQEECRIYLAAKKILTPHGLLVDSAARLLDDSLRRLQGATLTQATDFFLVHGKRVVIGATTGQCYDTYVVDLTRGGAGKYHLRDTRKVLAPFCEAFPGEVAAITTPLIDDWLGKRGGKARNKNNARDKVIAFFNFLVKKDFLPKGIPHAASCTTEFKDPRPVITTEAEALACAESNDIYTPDEMRKILAEAEADSHARVTIELKSFSGIRTEELARLWWVLVKEPDGQIDLPKAVAKLLQRTVPIFDNLKRRLALYPASEKKDKVSKLWNSANTLYHMWDRIADKAGVEYKRNGFRNSYISYRLTQTNDIKLVAAESGNSPEMIRKYYLDRVTPAQAQHWFSL
jgi:integrase